jgi:DNA polymerase-3 subunit delta'
MIDGVMEPLQVQQAEELAAYEATFEIAGVKLLKGDLKKMEDRHKREQRRVRTEELRSGLAVLLSHYREIAVIDSARSGDFVVAADEVQSLCANLVFNPRESLALQALFMSLPRLNPQL